MESINNLKNAATKAIWGDEQGHQEPLSGVNGDVSKGEPYDAGNMEPSEVSTKDTAPDETGRVPVETETSQPKATPSEQKETLSEPKEAPSQPKETPNPTKVHDSSILPGDSTKAQNDVRSPSDPDTHHANAAPKENVDDTGSGLDVGDNPEKLDGPGPRPLEVIAKENGGDAADHSGGSVDKGATHLPEDKKDSQDSGTGELYVKSSGLKADGGDFDAAQPGAGREADRLLEEKGVHVDHQPKKPEGNGSANGHAGGHGSPAKEKTSLKTKIKAKLHRNSGAATAST